MRGRIGGEDLGICGCRERGAAGVRSHVRFIFVSSLLLTEPKVYHAIATTVAERGGRGAPETWWSLGAVWTVATG
jgi:hypothetical protein